MHTPTTHPRPDTSALVCNLQHASAVLALLAQSATHAEAHGTRMDAGLVADTVNLVAGLVSGALVVASAVEDVYDVVPYASRGRRAAHTHHGRQRPPRGRIA